MSYIDNDSDGIRHQATFYIYAPYSGVIVSQLPKIPTNDYVLIENDGIYRNHRQKWIKVNKEIFYDEENRRFVMLDSNNKIEDAVTFTPIPGDIMLDGALGRIYLYDNGWEYDRRGTLKSSNNSITSIMIETSTVLTDGIRTVFCNPKANITVKLPSYKCVTHKTPQWNICMSSMITIVNISNYNVKVIADKIFKESVITAMKSATFQIHDDTWYNI
jgi:hypothetical protein